MVYIVDKPTIGWCDVMDNLARHLAENVLALRRGRGWSQQRLADLAQIPRSTLAGMESGSGNPSLHNLAAVAGAFHVSLEELLAKPRQASRLIAAADIPLHRERGGAIRVHDLLPERVRGLEIIRLELDAGAQRKGHPHLPGTREYLHGLEGEVSVIAAGELFLVCAGDVLAFPGESAHSYLNRSSRPASAISIVVPLSAAHSLDA